ncbi:MAG: hypothetical protein A2076_03360 [Geobacteraceae bacterium GWC2_53_11]|nr:MAG: hypothetical protein A2076_03360 [Geobacteraceae bacterium GWC2_53_11]
MPTAAMPMKRLLKFFTQQYLRRSLPHGIVSWRYLFPHPAPNVCIHRQLWLLGRHPRLPLPLYLFGECFLWLRWVSFACLRSCWRVVLYRGAEISQWEGIGTATLFLRVLVMGLAHCIPPGEIVTFGLYRLGLRQQAWNYIFFHETHAFHRWRDVRPGASAAMLTLIQDKSGLADLLASHGVPMVPTLGVLPRNAQLDPTPYLHATPRLFCKPRHGSASRDNFVIERRGFGNAPVIFTIASGIKTQLTSLDALHKAVGSDDFLVQPVMINHPLFAPLVPSEDAVILRIITEHHPAQDVHCYCATLEIPHPSDDGKHCHTILPVEPASGLILPFPGQRLPAPALARHDALFARLENCDVPFWDEIKTSAKAAHRQLPGLFAIAWDYVITPDGPLMLEGNSGWGATTPQILYGGLLRENPPFVKEN